MGKFNNEIASPRLSDNERLLPSRLMWLQSCDDFSNVVRDQIDFVAIIGLVAESVPAKIDGNDGVSEFGEPACGTVPEAGI